MVLMLMRLYCVCKINAINVKSIILFRVNVVQLKTKLKIHIKSHKANLLYKEKLIHKNK